MSLDAERARADAVLRGLYPCGRLERDGVTACWVTTQVQTNPVGGRLSPGTFAKVQLLARLADARVVGQGALTSPGDDVRGWVEANVLPPRSRDDVERRRRSRGFVSGLKAVANLLAPLGAAGDRTREQALARGMLRQVRACGAWDGADDVIEAACGRHARFEALAFRRFASRLDPEAMRVAMTDEHLAAVVGECWAGLDARHDPETPLLAAARAEPLFRRVLAEGWLADPEGVRTAVREGAVPALLDRLLVGGGHLPARLLPAARLAARGLRGGGEGRFAPLREARRSSALARGAPTEAVGHLIGLPASWAPGDDDEMAAYLDLCDLVCEMAAWCGDQAHLPTLLNVGGRWRAFERRLHEAAGLPPPGGERPGVDLLCAASDVGDMAMAYARQVLMPAAAAAEGAEPDVSTRAWRSWEVAGAVLLGSGRSLPRILEESRDWHARHDLIRAEVARLAGRGDRDGAWPAGLPDARIGDVWVHVVTTETGLVAEGARGTEDGVPGLDHCVGGYVEVCRRKGTRILSLRRVADDGSWTRLSTAQVDVDPEDGALVVTEHRGRSNARPGPEAVAALVRYMGMITDGELRVDAAGLEPLDVRADVEGACGFDWRDDAVRTRVAALWDRFVPGPLRGLDAAALWAVASPHVTRDAWRWYPETPSPVRAATPPNP